jgi:uncharacterized protein YbaP (TraB family)
MRRFPLVGAALLSLALGAGLAGPCGAEEPAGAAPATEPRIERPFLWVFENEAKVYVLGTMHLPATLTGALPKSVTDAIATSDAFFGELSNDDLQKQETLFAKIQNPKDRGLKVILPPELYARLAAYLEKKGLPLAFLDRMKPWLIAMMLPLLDFLKELTSGPAMDTSIGAGAVERGKESVGLETVDEQLAIFDTMTEAEQVQYLEITLDGLEKAGEEGKEATEELIAIYRSGDEDALARYFAKMTPKGEVGRKLMARILDDRNVRMADRIVEHAKKRPGKTLFVYVGAGHLPGEKGVIALLEAKGWKAKRVADEATTPAAPAKPAEKPAEEPAPVR